MSRVSTAPPSPASPCGSAVSWVRMTSWDLDTDGGFPAIAEEDTIDDVCPFQGLTLDQEPHECHVVEGSKLFEHQRRLAEVKAMFKAKFGEDVDDQEAEEPVWIVTSGLVEVKAMFKAQFGEDIDDDDEAEEPMWTVPRRAAPPRAKLETSLAEVRAMFKAKFGEDVDHEEAEEP